MSNIARQQERIDSLRERGRQLARLAHEAIQALQDTTDEIAIEVEILYEMSIPDDGGVFGGNDDETTMPTA